MIPDPVIGQQIGNYRIVDLIGRGGMGSVYRAENMGIKREVAIKLLLPHLSMQEDYLKRFHTEANAIARINHPGVVEIYDFGRTQDGSFYYVMELLRGRGLDQVVAERGRLSPTEILPCLVQICSALDAAHQAGVVHRDLKLDNIFVLDRSPLQIKLLDFGVAKLIDSGVQNHMQTSAGLLIGTPTFMAPEQAAGSSEQISPKTDFYALGVVLFYLLIGKAPFNANTAPELMVKHMREPPPRLSAIDPSLPQGLEQVIGCCLAKNPEDRPPSASWVAASFGAALGQSGISAPKTVIFPGALTEEDPFSPQAQVTNKMQAVKKREPTSPRSTSAETVERATVLEPEIKVEQPPLSGEFDAIEPGGTHAKIAALATRAALASEHHRSTLSGANGEVHSRKKRSSRLLLALSLGGLLGVGVGLVLFLRPGEKPAPVPTQAPLPVVEPLTQPEPKEPEEVPLAIQLVRMAGQDPHASCRYRVEGAEAQHSSLPCRIEVERGKHLQLELVRDGVALWSKRWQVNEDSDFSAEELVREKLAPDAGSHVARQKLIHSPPRRDVRSWKPLREKRATSRRHKRVRKAVPAKKRQAVPAKKKLPPKHVGSGTLDF